jgi:hypothetical protein
MKILTCVPVYNRKKLTRLVLENLYKYKEDSEIWVYNDWSSDYNNDYLEDICDQIFKLPSSTKKVVKNESNKKGMGVQHLRWYQLREFLNQDKFDYIYFTDNDAMHDPSYIEQLKEISKKYKLKDNRRLPVCLYNTRWHSQPQNLLKETEDVYMRKTAPGISQLFSKEMVEIMVKELDNLPEDPDYAWDYHTSSFLKLPFLTTKISFVEHYGADNEAMHATKGEWDRDRAINPTEYLAENRDKIIGYLEGKNEKPKV